MLRIHPAGDRAVLVELPGLPQVLSLQAQLQSAPLDGQIDVLAAAETVLVTADSPAAAVRIAEHVRTLDLGSVPQADTELVSIETVYDGADLTEVARLTGMSTDAVIAAHSGQTWTAAFGGFAPGFAYLVGENQLLEVPRRDSPRTAVPAGSVALAGNYSAVYPRETPGGWQLIGRTAARMWDLERKKPALIRPGNLVRFRPVRELVELAADPAPAPAQHEGGLLVIAAGLQSTLQDLGRPGYADLGVAEAGALDRSALRRANRLAGNPASAAVIEALHGGLVLEARADQVLAVTGADAPLMITGTDDGADRLPAANAPFALLAGERLSIGAPAAGLRSYLAVRGGFDAEPVLGSRSTDSMSGIGPAPLAAGTRLAVAEAPPGSVVGFPEPAPEVPAPGGAVVLRMVPGPRGEWFGEAELQRFCARGWTVTSQSNRIGLRLDGEPVARIKAGELASEGTVRGAIQIPPSGLPVLFLADHPVTGGYPVIGVVHSADLDRAAQLPPGATVRFTVTAPPALDAPKEK